MNHIKVSNITTPHGTKKNLTNKNTKTLYEYTYIHY